MNKIDSKDISVVVQGAIDKENTSKCLASIRKYLPNAEIILSTWEGEEVSNLDYDKILFNKDPGGADCSRNGDGVNNCNREIVSTFEGIKLVDRPYCLKIRSDLILTNNNILKFSQKFYKRNIKNSFFKQRILVPAVYSRLFFTKGKKILPGLFHISDWLYFGLSKDLYSLFDIPLTNEPEFSQWFKNKTQMRGRFEDTNKNRLWKFSPESYISLSCFKKYMEIDCKDKLDISLKNIELSRRLIINNFIIADLEQIGLNMPKYKIKQYLMPKLDREGLYSNYKWQKEYKKYCDREYKVKYTKNYILCIITDFLNIKRRGR